MEIKSTAMLPFVEDLYNKMSEALMQVHIEQEGLIQQAERAYHVTTEYLLELKEFILSYAFKEQEEEIRFFKEEKPLFLKEFIYYAELFYIESRRPVGDSDAQKKYLKSNLERIRIYFQRNNYLHTYYRTGKTYQDHRFFLHNAEDMPLEPAYSLDMDHRFSRVYSFKLSKLLAFEQLHDYILAAIHKLENDFSFSEKETPAKSITWTASKAKLIELAYALHSSGTFNFGKADLKQVVSALEDSFNIHVGNFYRVFQGQRIRKKSRTAFLDSLKENLIRRMDETDLNPKGIL